MAALLASVCKKDCCTAKGCTAVFFAPFYAMRIVSYEPRDETGVGRIVLLVAF